MQARKAIEIWCDWERRSGTTKVLPGSTSPYVGGLRKPRNEEELRQILEADNQQSSLEDLMAQALRECPDLSTIVAVREAFRAFQMDESDYPWLLHRYVMHRIGDGLPPESFHALSFPPDRSMVRTLAEMGWSVQDFLEESLDRFDTEVARRIDQSEAR